MCALPCRRCLPARGAPACTLMLPWQCKQGRLLAVTSMQERHPACTSEPSHHAASSAMACHGMQPCGVPCCPTPCCTLLCRHAPMSRPCWHACAPMVHAVPCHAIAAALSCRAMAHAPWHAGGHAPHGYMRTHWCHAMPPAGAPWDIHWMCASCAAAAGLAGGGAPSRSAQQPPQHRHLG